MRVYLGLGTNLGDKESNLHVAVRKINERIGEAQGNAAAQEKSGFFDKIKGTFSSEIKIGLYIYLHF